MFGQLNNQKVNNAMNMLGIKPVVYSPPIVVKNVAPVANIPHVELPDNDDFISVESIIRDKPPIKEVREFFKDNLEELELMDN